MADFARFNPDGSVEIFDWEKAYEIGAKVSVITRKEGRGKSAREVKITEIKMPNKFPALMKLLKYLSPPPQSRASSRRARFRLGPTSPVVPLA